MYEEYANIQNQLLNEIAGKMNLAGYNTFECQEINIFIIILV